MARNGEIRPRRLVLIEDDGEMRRLMVEAMRRDGHAVSEVADGHAFLDLLRRPPAESPLWGAELVITDGRMPGCSGLDIVRLMHRFDARVPVVLVTAFASEETHAAAMALGAVAVIDKPFDVDELRSVVTDALRRFDEQTAGDERRKR